MNFDIGSLGFDDGAAIDRKMRESVNDDGFVGEFLVSPINYEFRELGGKRTLHYFTAKHSFGI